MTNHGVPQSQEAERGVLGSMLLDPVRVLSVLREQKVSDVDFYSPTHQTIFNAILDTERDAKGNVVDLLTVSETLKSRKQIDSIGGDTYLNDIIDQTPSAHHVEHYVHILLDKSRRRRLIKMADEARASAMAEDQDILNAIVEAQRVLFAEAEETEKPKTTADAIFDCYDEYKAASLKRPKGLPCYLPEVNRYLGNFKEGKCHFVAAPPGRGKTTMLNNQAKHWAMGLNRTGEKIPVGYASIEMDMSEVIGNIIAEHADVSVFSLKTGAHEHTEGTPRIQKFMSAAKDFVDDNNADKLPLFINDKMMNIDQLCAWARLMVFKHGIKALCVDYLQLLKEAPGFGGTRKEEVDSVCAKLVKLAKDTGLTILIASQLTLNARRENRKPRASDLKESGAIEECAYTIMLIYEWEDEVYFSIDKNRGGLRREIPVVHEGNRQRFRTALGEHDERER